MGEGLNVVMFGQKRLTREVIELKKQAADFICNKYSWDIVVEETMKLYRRK